MNAAHLHLLVNHFPVLGVLFGAVLWTAAALIWKNDILRNLALAFFVLTAVAAIASYFSGEAAHEVVHGIPEVPAEPIEAHEEVAGYSTILAVVLGAVAALGLLDALKRRPHRPLWWWGSGGLGFLVTLMMIWTANLGGKIRHEEIRPGWEPVVEQSHTHAHGEEDDHAEAAQADHEDDHEATEAGSQTESSQSESNESGHTHPPGTPPHED